MVKRARKPCDACIVWCAAIVAFVGPVNASCPDGSWVGVVDATMPAPRNFIAAGLRVYPGESLKVLLADPGALANLSQTTGRRRAKSDVVSCFSGCPWEDYIIPNSTTISPAFPLQVGLWVGDLSSAAPGNLTDEKAVELSIAFPGGGTAIQQLGQPSEPRAFLPTAAHTPCPAHTCSTGSFSVCAIVDSKRRGEGLAATMQTRRLDAPTVFEANFLNQNLREFLATDRIAANGFAAGLADQVSKFHVSAQGQPEGASAYQFLQYALLLDGTNRKLLDLVTKYYLNIGDFDAAAKVRFGNFRTISGSIFLNPPLLWEEYRDFIDDGILIAGAMSASRPLQDDQGPSDQASVLELSLRAYDQYLLKNPAVFSEPVHRRRYTYLAALLSQAQQRSGTISSLQRSAIVAEKPTRFYAEQETGRLIAFDPSLSLSLIESESRPPQALDSVVQAQQSASVIASPAAAAPAVTPKSYAIVAAPREETRGISARVQSIDDTDGKLSCASVGFASAPDGRQAWAVCNSKVISLLEDALPKEITLGENSENEGRNRSLIKGGLGAVYVAETNQSGKIETVWNLSKEVSFPTRWDFPKISGASLAHQEWRIASRWAGGDSRLVENVGFWRFSENSRVIETIQPGSGASVKAFSVPQGASGQVVAANLGNNLNDYILVPDKDSSAWLVISPTGIDGRLPRDPSTKLVGMSDTIILTASRTVDQKVRLRIFKRSDRKIIERPCSYCNDLPIKTTADSFAAVLGTEGEKLGIVYATDEGIVVIMGDELMRIAPVGPSGIPLLLRSTASVGFVYGVPHSSEIGTWRFSAASNK